MRLVSPTRLVRSIEVEIQQRSHRISTLPILILYLNDICNSRCVTCAIWQNNTRLKVPDERQMSGELLANLYTEMKSWRPLQVVISGGEPTMHPRLSEVVRQIRAIGPRLALVTNGLLLASYSREELLAISEFYISFDAPDAASYETIRGVDGFSKMTDGVGYLRSISPRPRIVARCTLQRQNVTRLQEVVDAAQEIGFDAISFLGVDISTEAFARGFPDHSVDPARIQPQAAELEAMDRSIQALEQSAAASFIEGGAGRLRKILQYFNALLGRANFPAVDCNAPWVSSVIETTGKLRGCFFHPVIGDWKTINGPQAVEFRRSLDVRTNPTCQRCVCSKLLRTRDLLHML